MLRIQKFNNVSIAIDIKFFKKGFGSSTAPQQKQTTTGLFGTQPAGSTLFGGFSSTPATTSSGFSFSANPTAQTAPSAFGSFGQNTGFGTPAATAQSAPTSFGFGSTPSTQTTTPAATSFGFGSTQATTPAASSFGFGSTPSTQTSTPAASSFGFGSTSSTQAATKATPSFGFGSTPSGQAATSFNFGSTPSNQTGTQPVSNTSNTTATTASTKPATLGFGTPATAAATTTQATSFPQFGANTGSGGFSFGATPATTASTTLSTTKSDGFVFSTPAVPGSSVSQPAATTEGSLFSTPATTKSVNFSLSSSTPTTDNKLVAKDTPGPLNLSDLGTPHKPTFGAPFTTSAPATTALATPSTPATHGKSSGSNVKATGTLPLKNKTMQDILNKWTNDLETNTREFHKLAEDIKHWDRILLENGYLISNLFNEISTVEKFQVEIESELEYIESEQQELDLNLKNYEEKVREIYQANLQATTDTNQGTTFKMTPVDEEREKNYLVAENINKQLDDMGKQLKNLIEDINLSKNENKVKGSGEGMLDEGDDTPIDYIVKILGQHLSSLEWLDQSTTQLLDTVKEVDAQALTVKEVAERVHKTVPSRSGSGENSNMRNSFQKF
ncbi:FG-nucleoporin nsp1 [Lobulomyces angularis]|nr:FG-nucleoporin nsp1 [Lobulomyces angularis]